VPRLQGPAPALKVKPPTFDFPSAMLEIAQAFSQPSALTLGTTVVSEDCAALTLQEGTSFTFKKDTQLTCQETAPVTVHQSSASAVKQKKAVSFKKDTSITV